MLLTQARSILKAAIVLFAAACAAPSLAQEALVPTPKAVIYPGDVILDEMLVDVANVARDGSGPFVDSRSLIVGKAARLTLLPGHAIPFSGISNRKLVSNGTEVKLVFSEGDLVIMTTGAALQDGSIGTSSGSATTTAASQCPAPSSRTARSE
jgi:flagella basal body P-ring formation protein FlgA